MASVNVTGRGVTGSLVGIVYDGGVVENSYATGHVRSTERAAGGLVGHIGQGGKITDSHASVSVVAYETAGGLAASVWSGQVSGSYATGNVHSLLYDAGGLVGSLVDGGWITGSYATGTVRSGASGAGGLVGRVSSSHRGIATRIDNSYATGSVRGHMVGGLVGPVGSDGLFTINSYATGELSFEDPRSQRRVAGGLFPSVEGRNSPDASNSYWDTDTTGQTTSAAGEGKTTSELQSPTSNTGIYAEWDPAVWDFGTSSQYPTLKNVGPTVAPPDANRTGWAPTNLRVVSVDDGQVTLAWQPAPNAEFHWIWSGKADGTAGKWTPAGGSAGSATVTGLAGGPYHFVVIAGRTTNGQPGWSDWSNWVQATPAATSQPGAQVSAGRSHTCGVRIGGKVACWGDDSLGQATPPGGTFQQVSAGGNHTCGVRTDGEVACWGWDNSGRATPPGGTFQQVSASGSHTCGVRTDGEVACWGSNINGGATPPGGTFQQVSAGGFFACAVRTVGGVACWGANNHRQATPPGGTFQQISAGGFHACGMRTDGEVACWGLNGDGQATPPGGTFQQVSAGLFHTCGVRTDGVVACWGDDGSGRATPPGGTFQQVSAGGLHTCGVRTSGEFACWGLNGDGQATPTTPAEALGDPTNLRVVSVGDGQVNLAWRPASNADAHWVGWTRLESDGTETPGGLLEVAGTASSATVTGLENGQTYAFVVVAIRSVGGKQESSQQSNRAEATPAATSQRGALGNPTNLRVVSVGDGQVNLAWRPASNADAHWIGWTRLESDDTESPGGLLEVAGTASSATITGLENGQTYAFVVVAVRNVGGQQENSQQSNRVQAIVTAATATSDRAALVALYRATGGDNWHNTQRNDRKWLVDDPNSSVSEWYGVTTNPQGRVTRIELMGNNLNGEIPEALESLDWLITLNLLANEFTGCIPRGLNEEIKDPYLQAKGGTILDAGVNTLEDNAATAAAIVFAVVTFFSHELEGVNRDWGGWRAFSDQSHGLGLPPCPPPLEKARPEGWTATQTSKTDAQALLAIRKHYIDAGNDPNKVNNLDTGGGWTEAFSVYANDPNSPDCPSENPFKTRKRRVFPDENIHGVGTKIIDGCHRVTDLHLDQRGLQGRVPSAIGRLGELTSLNLSWNVDDGRHRGLSGEIPRELGNLTNLIVLALNNNQLSGEIPAELGHLSKLTFLALNANNFQGDLPPELGNLAQVEHLKLVESGLGGCVPPPIRQNIAPSVLSLANNISMPVRILEFAAEKGGRGIGFLARIAGRWDDWWKTEGTDEKIKDRARQAAVELVDNSNNDPDLQLVQDATAKTIEYAANEGGDKAASIAIGTLQSMFGYLGRILDIVSAVLSPVDFIFKPGSTAAWTSLGDVSLNCSTLNPLK